MNDNTRENVKNVAKRTIMLTIGANMMAILLYSSTIFNDIGLSTSRKITKEEFYQVVKEEKELIESQKNTTKVKNIETSINNTIKTSHVIKTDTADITQQLGDKEEHTYTMCIKTSQLTRFAIRHELYHIYKGHTEYDYNINTEITKLRKTDSQKTPLKYLGDMLKIKYKDEFQASAYAIFGPKYHNKE
jgi:hypothetical protein